MNQENMKVVESGLVPIYENNGTKYADARELHEFLEVGKDFSTWIKDKIEKYAFVEGDDYSPIMGSIQGRGQPRIEYILTLDTAKEIAMVENNDRGRQVRKYFIEVEKRARNQKPMTPAEILAEMAKQNVEMERKLNSLDARVTNIVDVFAASVADNWKAAINSRINRIVAESGQNHQAFRQEIYSELEGVARVNLQQRQIYRKDRLYKQGASVKECDAVSKLEIIERDPQLRAIFEGIVKKYQIRYMEVANAN